jgi:hypothetical protein
MRLIRQHKVLSVVVAAALLTLLVSLRALRVVVVLAAAGSFEILQLNGP